MMVYALHKFHHYLLGKTFIFYVDHRHYYTWFENRKFQKE
jgi:hypothetical protein